MNWTTVKQIYLREVRDQCRDRRTLFMLLILPILMYPALGYGLIQLTLNFGKEVRRIGIVGADRLPEVPPLLDTTGKFFAKDLFENEENQPLYDVRTQSDSNSPWTIEDLRARRIDALIVVPEDLEQKLRENRQAKITVLHNSTEDQSRYAYAASVEFLQRWEKRIVVAKLEKIGQPDDFADPIEIDSGVSDVSSVQERSGNAWSKVFPFVLVIMALTGAFYPAVDLCAGEKERGTMETLLITPASRGEIVLGKFLTIVSISVTSTVLNLISMGLTVGQVSALMPAMPDGSNAFAPPTLDAIAWMFVLMLPLAAFFSALCMALAVFARSTKEGQYYMMPMFLVVTPLVFLTLAPGVQLDLFYSLVPVTNVALLLRAFMQNQYELAMMFLLPVLIPTALYGYLALRFAVDQFHREEVLFREAERFDFRLWIKHLLRDKDPIPSATEAWSLFILMMFVNWYLRFFLSPTLVSVVVPQLVVIGFLPVLFALMLTSNPARTLSLRKPALFPAVLGLLLVVCLHPVVVDLGHLAQKLFPLPEALQQATQQLLAGTTLWQRLVVFAVVPAICEELAFRGFILRGLLTKYSPPIAIVISSVLFGVMHMISAQMLIATLLGIILGLLLTRTGSLIPGMVFHSVHNGAMVIRASLAETSGEMSLPDKSNFAVLVAGALASAILAGILATLPNKVRNDEIDGG